MPYRLTPSRILPLALGCALLAGCASDGPYYAQDYRYHQLGIVNICYSPAETPFAKVQKMAEEKCNRYERTAQYQYTQKYQCSLATPDLVYFTCVARPGEHPPPFVNNRAPMRREPLLQTDLPAQQ